MAEPDMERVREHIGEAAGRLRSRALRINAEGNFLSRSDAVGALRDAIDEIESALIALGEWP